MYLGPQKNKVSSEQEIDIKQFVYEKFSTLLNFPSEEGTCKKMIRLSHLKPEWAEYAVVFGHRADSKHAQIVQDERKYLAHLQENNYPVVEVIGKEFVVALDQTGNERFGMVMRYMPGIFIEAKTVPPLKIYIIAALLGIEYIRPQEAWLALNKKRLLDDIEEKIKNPILFAKLQTGAKTLEHNFDTLIAKFEQDQEMVVDLQMIISSEGTLTIIDPLDVVKQNQDECLSILPDAPKPNDDLLRFIKNTRNWLKLAKQTCSKICSAQHYADLSSLLNLDVEPLVFSTRSDPRGHSRISQIKSQSQSQAPSPTTKKLFF
ncbi:MAG: hypothetical protein HYX61_05370 [Gammaproteobacteria bacterium]|jgi:sulfur relay (sulfurtransferase) DsrC/TusE family protein|nr:hypothetical protein [Gammaproteobacteria bacterium]